MAEHLLHAGKHSRQLYIQCLVLKRLKSIARKIFKTKHSQPAEMCKKLLRKELNRDLPDTIQIRIPLNPRWRAKKIIGDVQLSFSNTNHNGTLFNAQTIDTYLTEHLCNKGNHYKKHEIHLQWVLVINIVII